MVTRRGETRDRTAPAAAAAETTRHHPPATFTGIRGGVAAAVHAEVGVDAVRAARRGFSSVSEPPRPGAFTDSVSTSAVSMTMFPRLRVKFHPGAVGGRFHQLRCGGAVEAQGVQIGAAQRPRPAVGGPTEGRACTGAAVRAESVGTAKERLGGSPPASAPSPAGVERQLDQSREVPRRVVAVDPDDGSGGLSFAASAPMMSSGGHIPVTCTGPRP